MSDSFPSSVPNPVKPLKLVAKNLVWSIGARFMTMLIKFFTIPIILGYYGKVEYGLVVLAMSLSGYMSIANLALPTGMIRHTAVWLGTGQITSIEKASRSSFSFYGFIGFINAAIFIILAFWGLDFFKVPHDKVHDLKIIFIISAFGTFLTWPFSVVEQLLAGAQEIAWLEKVNIAKEFLVIVITLAAIWMNLAIVWFYLLILAGSKIIIPVNLWKWRKHIPLRRTFVPGWFWAEFKEVLTFGLGLLIIGISLTSIIQLRPIILSVNSMHGVASAAEYRVLFGITGILMAFQGAISRTLLPLSSNAVAVSDQKLIETIIFKGTKYLWTILALLIFGLIMVSDRLLTIYVGAEYAKLAPWLALWLLSFLNYYLGPVASVVMGSGKIKLLMITSPLSAAISITTAWFLTPKLGVGAVAISTLTYYGLVFFTYHVYFLPHVLKISPVKLLSHSFVQPLVAGILLVIAGRWSATVTAPDNPYLWLVISSLIGTIVYIGYILLFHIPLKEIKQIILKFKKERSI